jgi:hypothetical protein
MGLHDPSSRNSYILPQSLQTVRVAIRGNNKENAMAYVHSRHYDPNEQGAKAFVEDGVLHSQCYRLAERSQTEGRECVVSIVNCTPT